MQQAEQRVSTLATHVTGAQQEQQQRPRWDHRLVLLGAGINGQCLLPLMFEYIDIRPSQVMVLSANNAGKKIAARYGVPYVVCPLNRENYRQVLGQYLTAGDFLLNMTVCVGSVDVVEWCFHNKIVYLDASLEAWGHEFIDTRHSALERCNYRVRQSLLDMRNRLKAFEGSPTAVICHGANPGLAESFAKQAIIDVYEAVEGKKLERVPKTGEEWAALSERLGIKVIQVCERDAQQSTVPKRFNEFIQTWSAFGYLEELMQPAELGWGTHEKHLPEEGLEHKSGNRAAIMINKCSAACNVRTWCPTPGSHFGTLTTHHECLELADYLTLRGPAGEVKYRPTVMYAYHPCDDSVLSVRELAEREYKPQEHMRILQPPNIQPGGFDEVGMLVLGHARTGYWYGCHNTIEAVTRRFPGVRINATTFPVIFGILAGIRWAICHPDKGIVEPADMDHAEIIEFVKPIINCFGVFTDWTPLSNRSNLVPAGSQDASDPWQFCNFVC
eukprot:TRINITY_DN2559_c0_g1_i1.p1 TRINITY_DN2559_c0_g1~~TRINITY_DN2559_c0_g1_i1.p1  ORF type:complete len:522 (-),score=148.37 TRINITY_DN2559_c0_g1_i1:113-1612(-)